MAIVFVAIIHMTFAWVVYPDPMPRRDLRRKIIPLTQNVTPALIVAGDSRLECGLIPGVLAEHAGLPPADAINMAAPACDLPGALAGYREFAERFQPGAIMVAGVSVVDVNDHADPVLIGDETLWSLGLIERCKLVAPKRAFLSLFIPEREWLRRNLVEPVLLNWDYDRAVAEQGYRGEWSEHEYPPDYLARELRNLDHAWYHEPIFDGARWRLFVDAVRTLRARGVQLVLLDPPIHPAFTNGVAGTAMGADDERFHQQLADFCREEGVPLLRYTARDLCADDPASSFVSLVHLNRTGAKRLSTLVGDELALMQARGLLHAPGTDY